MAKLRPITRKEKYLAKAGGQSVTVPLPPITREEQFLKDIIDAIASAVAAGTAIKYKGSKANIAALPTIATTPEGYMYTLISGGTTTSDFVEGAGHTIPDGENVAAVNVGTKENPVMKWDTLGGITDGLQPLITMLNKLSSDLVDDSNSTNKFVTATEKQVWNGKQNAIDSSHKLPSRLVDDSTSTNKFVTSTEKQTWNGKQDALTFDTTPTQNSTNPVESGGVYTALGSKADLANGFVPPAQLPPEVFLPEVTAEDAGKVLSVNSNGEWTAETPAGDNSTLIIPASINTGTYVVTFEKTTDELVYAIRNALVTNKNIIIIGKLSSMSYRLFQFVNITSQNLVEFESILRLSNATSYWTISFSASYSKTTQFTAVNVNDPA